VNIGIPARKQLEEEWSPKLKEEDVD